MRVLVLGAGGYVGNLLCRLLLQKEYKVRAVDNFYKGHCDELIELTSYAGFEFRYGNVINLPKKFYEDVDAIINLAGVVGFPACDADPKNAEYVNHHAIKTLLDQRDEINKNIPFITCSTDSVFGVVTQACNEDTIPNPQTLYGRTKLAGEKIALDRENTIALRFSTGCGVSPRMRVNLLVNDLVFQALSNKSITVFEPDVYRSFIDVKDMAKALFFFMQLALMRKNRYNLYCIGSDHMNFTKRELAEFIKKKTNCHVTYHDFDKDRDCRNYHVSHTRQNETGFLCSSSMDYIIDDLIEVYPLLQFQRKYQ